MSRNLVTLGLVASLALTLGGCWPSLPTEPSQAELDQARVDAANKRAAEEQAKREANADENGLVATSDPRVFKATKVLPKPESSVNAVKPEYPALGYEHSYEGAEAVALYFQDLVSYTFNSGDVTPFKEICLESSKYCTDVVASVEKNEREGSWHEGIKNINTKVLKWGIPQEDRNIGEYSFVVTAEIAEYTYFDKPTMRLKKKRGYNIEAFTNLSFIDGRWVVVTGGSEIKR